jgi:tocopherol O-methyltransferase
MFTKNDIITYFNRCEWQYRKGWCLDTNMAFHSGFWNDSIQSLSDAIINENEYIASLIGITSDFKILDAGCGLGGTAVFLAKKFNCEVKGISIVPKQVCKAQNFAEQQKINQKVTFIESDYLSTPFEDQSFDAIIAIESVCYAESKRRFFEESYRILKKGGQLVIADIFQINEKLLQKQHDLLYRKALNRVAVEALGTRQTFLNYLTDAGFVEFSYSNTTDMVKPSFRMMMRGSLKYAWLGWILCQLKHITKTEYENLLVGINLWRSLNKNLVEYGVLHATK